MKLQLGVLLTAFVPLGAMALAQADFGPTHLAEQFL